MISQGTPVDHPHAKGRAEKALNLQRKALMVSDSGITKKWRLFRGPRTTARSVPCRFQFRTSLSPGGVQSFSLLNRHLRVKDFSSPQCFRRGFSAPYGILFKIAVQRSTVPLFLHGIAPPLFLHAWQAGKGRGLYPHPRTGPFLLFATSSLLTWLF